MLRVPQRLSGVVYNNRWRQKIGSRAVDYVSTGNLTSQEYHLSPGKDGKSCLLNAPATQLKACKGAAAPLPFGADKSSEPCSSYIVRAPAMRVVQLVHHQDGTPAGGGGEREREHTTHSSHYVTLR